jgi:Zinc knuckle
MPTTFTEWVTAAKIEHKKNARYEVMMGHDKHKYEWRTPQQMQQHQYGGHLHHHHRNGRPHHDTDSRPYNPMNVDLPTFTRVNHAYTEQDKDRFKKEGRCFYCDKQGHMARECPSKKHQSFSSYRAPSSSYGAPPSTFGKKKPFNKPSSNTFNCPKP